MFETVPVIETMLGVAVGGVGVVGEGDEPHDAVQSARKAIASDVLIFGSPSPIVSFAANQLDKTPTQQTGSDQVRRLYPNAHVELEMSESRSLRARRDRSGKPALRRSAGRPRVRRGPAPAGHHAVPPRSSASLRHLDGHADDRVKGVYSFWGRHTAWTEIR